MDIYVPLISIVECPCMDIPSWASNGYPYLCGEFETDIQKSWISIWITDFWKSMYGYAVDYRTRGTTSRNGA